MSEVTDERGAVGRIARRFGDLQRRKQAGLVTFVTAGDPDYATSMEIVRGLPTAGADLIELGMPFSDPMADGPAIQESSVRALRGGQTMVRTLAMVSDFRRHDAHTPIVLMGYFNPIYAYGVERFVVDAHAAGVDGLIVVDLPPEEHAELRTPARARGLEMILLVAPTTGDRRLQTVLGDAGGFVYSVSVSGITGTRSASADEIAASVVRIKRFTGLPVAVGFGIKTAQQAAHVAAHADAAVVGSAIVERIAAALGPVPGTSSPRREPANAALAFVGELAVGVRTARENSPTR